MNKKIGKFARKSFGMALFGFSFFFVPFVVFAYTIDSTGGDCSTFGAWDGTTCILTQNISDSISIDGNNITLDGNGHTITGNPSLYAGVSVNANNVTVKNLTIQGFGIGIGMWSWRGENISVKNNTIIGPGTYGIVANDADTATFFGNIIKNFDEGFHFEYCSMGHIFSGNTIENNTLGVYFQGSSGTFTQNNFKNNTKNIENVTHLFDCGGGFETLSQPLPIGGNYWSNNTSFEDANNDGVCDTSFFVTTDGNGADVYDNFPWIKENGWNAPPPTTITLTNPNETEDDGIQDAKGVADKTKFTFDVLYTGATTPDLVKAIVENENGTLVGNATLYLHSTTTDYSNGATFFNSSTFPKGKYTYRFEAKIGEETKTLEGGHITTGYSNVAFLPGIEASRLYINGYKQWEPLGDYDAEDLLLDSYGKSVKDTIYTKDVINNAYLPIKGNVYQTFIESMNTLKSEHVIVDWKPLAYDWRLSFDDVLNNGQIMNDGVNYTREISPLDTPNIIGEIHRLAESSDTGKVTIVTHSMGGLLAKKLTLKLGDDAPKLLDQMIFVAAPQAGTPQAIGALLHGANVALPLTSLDYGISPKEGRKLSQNMPSAYVLIPSAKYFKYVDNDVITFDNSDFLKPWRDKYGQKIHSQELLHTFLADQSRPSLAVYDPLSFPSSTNLTLLTNAEILHDTEIDNWVPPTGVELTEIAGWGVETLTTIDYKKGIFAPCLEWKEATCVKKDEIPVLEPHLKTTIDGDGTVVVPSALWTATSTGVRKYWVDLARYNDEPPQSLFHLDHKHADILEVPELRELVNDIFIRNGEIPQNFVYTKTPPNDYAYDIRLHFTLHSPLTLNLYDDQGNHTGFSTSTHELEENIPGSSYITFGELKYISVPSSSNLHLVMNGYASGSFTLDIEEWKGDIIIASTTFAAIPSETDTAATITVLANEGVAGASSLLVDENGDGKIDITLAPKIGETVFPDFTPPEAKISVDPNTKDLKIEGVDESPTTVTKNGNNYVITDSSGNTTTLFFQKTFTRKLLTFAKITGIQYGTNPKISLPSSSFIYLWNPALISQTIAVKKDVLIEVIYNKKKDQTTVFLKKKGTQIQKQIFTGLKIVKLVVNKGVVGYEI
jgi:parallel beta-helix repeat protein